MPRSIKMLEASVLAKAIGAIGKRKVTLDKDVQAAAIQCVLQSIEHRNATPAMQLFDALGTSSRRDALVAYFEMYGNLAWMKAEKKMSFFEADLTVASITPEFEDKIATTLWHTTRKEPVPRSAYDLEEEFDKVLDRLTKVSNKPGNEVKHKGLLDVLTAAFRHYQFEQMRIDAPIDVSGIEHDDKEAAHAAALIDNANTPASHEAMAALAVKFGGMPKVVNG